MIQHRKPKTRLQSIFQQQGQHLRLPPQQTSSARDGLVNAYKHFRRIERQRAPATDANA